MPGETRGDPRYDVLFEPIAIGPVTARNRFYQVPHCNGMGYRDPTALAWMRRAKAEGGWAVVCTEEVEIHHTSDIAPCIELRLWDDRDLPALARIADRIHEFGALAGIELAYNGPNGANSYGREVPLAPSAMPVATSDHDPVQARAMTKRDIRDLRRWHRAAALRGRKAGFDLVYVYAAHGLSILQYFLSRHHNRRSDEYGGSPENRVRLLREILTDTREAVGDTCAVPCRISTDELLGPNGLGRAEELEADAVVLVTSRAPEDRLALELADHAEDWSDAGIEMVTAIGDALAPATIARAVYAGRRYAEELDGPPRTGDEVPFRRELAELVPLD